MKRKRFKHIAFTVCHMFSGWQLINSYSEIKRLGTGIYQYDFNINELRFNGEIIEPLTIFGALQSFFNQEIERMKIDKNSITEAYIVIDLHYSQNHMNKQIERPSEYFFKDEKNVGPKSNVMNEITYNCVSCIETDEKQYNCLFNSSNSWPEGWLID